MSSEDEEDGPMSTETYQRLNENLMSSFCSEIVYTPITIAPNIYYGFRKRRGNNYLHSRNFLSITFD